ncbi:MAG TPA: hypothetical protein VGP07_15950 [Polyangia bacterium]
MLWGALLVGGCASHGAVPVDAGGGDRAPDPGTGGVTASGGRPDLGGAPANPGTGGTPGAGGALGAIAGLQVGPPSDGATITFTGIGAAGWMPSRRDPASGTCDAYSSGTCCMAKLDITDDQMTPWDQDLIMTLRGPMLVAQLAVYQPSAADGAWTQTARWSAAAKAGIAFDGQATSAGNFAGTVGSQCLVNVSTDRAFPCGAGSSPYCTGSGKYYGWAGSKLFVVLASMPHAGTDALPAAQSCSTDTSNGWYDAPWLGISHGELIRAGAFQSCQCYDKTPGSLKGDGCGQINAFEVVNDNNSSRNLDLFSTNFFGYQGYIGEGPCGTACDVTALDPAVDLVNKKTSQEAAAGALSSPGAGPGAAFRRPAAGYRYFIVLMNASARTVQMAMVHPANVPTGIAAFLPALPASVPQTTIDALMQLRLPH